MYIYKATYSDEYVHTYKVNEMALFYRHCMHERTT